MRGPEQWLLCMSFNAFDEGERRVLGGHCHYIAPLEGYALYCPECVQAQLSSRRKAPARVFAGHPPGPVAIVCGQPVTLEQLLADASRRVGLARFPVSAEFPAQENAAKQESAYPYSIKNAAEWREEFTERAAIFEYLGGHTRAVAETMALELVGACP